MVDSNKEKRNIHIIAGSVFIVDVDRFMQKIQEISKRNQIIIQAFNADMICGKNHIYSAATHAIRAEKQNSKATHSLAMELLLYAAGERQVKHALQKMGITQGKSNIALVIINLQRKTKNLIDQCIESLIDQFNIQLDDSVITCSTKKIKNFGITDQQLKTLSEEKYEYLVLEQIAQVDIIK
ncbi:MAG: KEOPS complex subunit Cgi121 [Thermoplasmatota archaeon]